MKKIVFTLVVLFHNFLVYSQIIYGANQYTEYHLGTLPVIISVPHGGNITPSNIPDRVCNSAVTVTDANTIQLGKQIDSAFVAATGCHPYLIYCNLHRAKLDCNRNIADGACGNMTAENAWNEFNNFINTAQASAQSQYGDGKAFYIDLHGHGNSIQRLELGYLLYDNELEYSDSILNSPQYVNYSTIQNLVANNINGYTHAELLRGTYALGTLLGSAGYPSVPSMQIPFPGTTSNYFSGGYNAAHHTSYALGNMVNGLQIECNYTNVRDTYANRKLFADSLVSVITSYLKKHLNIDFANCQSLAIKEDVAENPITISPNPSQDYIQISLPKSIAHFEVEIINTLGQTVLQTSNQSRLNVAELPKGVYMLKIKDALTNVWVNKIILE